MYLDIPEFTRCCFCFPLRRGLLTFGYLNLIFSLLALVAMFYGISVGRGSVVLLLDVAHNFLPNGIMLIVLYIIEFIFNIVLIIGGHKKSVLLLKIFFYYGLTTTAAMLMLEVIIMCNFVWFFGELCFLFSANVLQGYILLLVKSEIDKLSKAGHPAHFLNTLTGIVVTEHPAPDTRTLVVDN